MSAAMPSDEVALDFQDSLQDLQSNNRYEISNLTIIAKENTEHAQAIAQVLEKHIRTTGPTRKLPALYVLDSIVKNVGTPYTVYLGRNLFSTFMEAYTLVGSDVRKAMDAMLKTWKEPVPGSLDPRPVFPHDVTRTIENALIKFRTIAVQQQQNSRTQRPPLGLPQRPLSSTAYRNTPTPPQNGSRYAPPPPSQPYQNGYPSQQPTPVQFPTNPPIDIARSLSALLNPQEQESKRLLADIQGLIGAFQSEFSRSPFDQTVQMKLKALLDLKAVVETQKLPPDAMNAIKAQVAALQAALPQPPQPASTPSFIPPQMASQWPPPTPMGNAFPPPPQLPQQFAVPAAPPSQTGTPTLPNFAPGVLESLLKSATNGQKPSTPTMAAAIPMLQGMPMPPPTQSPRAAAAAPALPPQGNALLDALRAAGIVGGGPTPTPAPAAALPTPAPAPAQTLLQQLQGLAPALTSAVGSANRIPLSAPNFKTFRPDLIHSLYDAQPNQCTTCSRRFPADAAGRHRKAQHLDWHFRTNQRIADAASKAQNRSWYIDELEWIQLHDLDSSVDASSSANDPFSSSSNGGGANNTSGGGGQNAKPKSAKDRFIPAPTGAEAIKNAACPICQEKFDNVWHDEAQEWVWMDAQKVGGRVYHASCHEEVSRASSGQAGFVLGQDSARERSGTPEGARKRKAEGDLAGFKAKLKREVVA